MLLLQGFLFSAYGFSMSAEGASLSSRAYELNPTAAAMYSRDVFTQNLANQARPEGASLKLESIRCPEEYLKVE
jgi:hypothetical protein